MLVGDDTGVQPGEVFTDGREAFAEFPHAEAGIDQDACVAGGHERGVTGTAARQNAEFDDGRPPELLGYMKMGENRIGEKCLLGQVFWRARYGFLRRGRRAAE
jgi:hypothetical protein